jgi:hypothetical protein
MEMIVDLIGDQAQLKIGCTCAGASGWLHVSWIYISTHNSLLHRSFFTDTIIGLDLARLPLELGNYMREWQFISDA